jgi:chemotaxis protein methyltransferase CheR
MEHLTALEDLLTELTGVQLTRGGLQSSLAAFAVARTQELGLDSIQHYLRLVAAPESAERRRLLDVIGVPHTWFFRDREQLESIMELLQKTSVRGKTPQIWIPACATGEDAYSLAMLCVSRGLTPEIVASDISPRSLAAAREARYGSFSLRDFPAELRNFLLKEGRESQVCDQIRTHVTFVEHNLMTPPLCIDGGWDVILCRNVTIYFDQPTAQACAKRLARVLSSGGWLFFGAGEMAVGAPTELSPTVVGNRIGFRRADASIEASPTPRPSQILLPSVAAEIKAGSLPDASAQSAQLTQKDAPSPQKIRTLVGAEPDAPSGQRLFQGADFAEAADEILSLAAAAPSDANLRMLSAIALYSIGDFSGALRQTRATLLLDRRLWPAALYQGLCLEKLGEHKKARADFEYAARLLESRDTRDIELPVALRGLSGDLLTMVRTKSRSL